ncbi:MAG: hypothetical protein M5U14_03930 [Acidimicrobiia bacterium]|nr:hypothetical protein [Acidimicrobiia bacterium]
MRSNIVECCQKARVATPYPSRMAVSSVSFDDDSDEDLCVFSGSDLLISHYDVADLDWQEVAERSAVDERRGLVITQVAVFDDLVDEFILYLADPVDEAMYRADLDRLTIGPRLDRLESIARTAGILDVEAEGILAELRRVVRRRNNLAHGTISCRPVRPVQPGSWIHTIEFEWVLSDRRSGATERITMAGLRQDVCDAIGAFTGLLAYAEKFVRVAAAPRNFAGGMYLAAPTA